MSDDWESYPCSMGEHLAWIAFDRGLSREIAHVLPQTCVRLRLTLRHPSPRGMPDKVEFDALNAFEDSLVPFIEERGGHYAGRVTTQGFRHFIGYAEISEGDLQAFCATQSTDLGYEIAIKREHDPKRCAYWDELFPKPDDDSVIQDRKVFEALRAHGDSCSQPRRIDHWAYFPTRESATSYAVWVAQLGYTGHAVEHVGEATNPFLVRFHGEATPTLGEFTSANIALRRTATALRGAYDGWESIVVKDGT